MANREKYVLAVDHGTSAMKTAIVSVRGQVMDVEKQPLPITFLPGGGAEQDPGLWWEALVSGARALVQRQSVPVADIVAVCVSSTFSTTVAVDAHGYPAMPALTWMDSRGAPFVRAAMAGFPSVMGYGLAKAARWIIKTGGAPSLSGKDDIGHALLVQHAFPDVYAKTRMFLPSKDFLNLKLTGVYASTPDAMTLFWIMNTRDIRRVRYDRSLIKSLGLDPARLPPLVSPHAVLGNLTPQAAEAMGLLPGVKVVAGAPDHQAACIGSGAVRDFEGHIYIGTSSWVQCVVPFKKTDPLHSIASLPTSIPGKYYCANEQDMAGGCLDFLAKNLLAMDNRENPFARLDALAASVPPGAGGLIFCPWLNGERTPVDDPLLGGGFFNLRKTAQTAHLARAVLEGVACNTRWSLQYVERFIKRRMDKLSMVGGGARSDLWCQIHADILDRTIRQVQDPMEANARGAAFIASVGLGRIRYQDIPGLVSFSRVFSPNPRNRKTYGALFREFVRIHKNNKAMFHRLNKTP